MCNTLAYSHKHQCTTNRFKKSRSLSPPSLADEQQFCETVSAEFASDDPSSLVSDAMAMTPANEMSNTATEGADRVIVSMLQLVEMLEEWTTHRSYPPSPVLEVRILEDHDEVILSAFAKSLENYTRRCPSRIQYVGLTLHPKFTLDQAKLLSMAIRRCHKLRAVRLEFDGARHRHALLLAAAVVCNPSVRSLILDGNGLTDISVRWLGGILARKYQTGQHRCTLKHLSLCDNPITPAALAGQNTSIWKHVKVEVKRFAHWTKE